MAKRKKTKTKGALGRLYLNGHYMELVVDHSRNGSFVYADHDAGRQAPRLVIGIAGPWWKTVDLLMHEMLEFVMSDQNHRYTATGEYTSGSDAATFILRHDQFSAVVATVADTWEKAQTAVRAAWDEFHKNDKK